MEVQQAYEHCKTIIEYHSKTFSKAFNHLPKVKRHAVWAVYAFCRTADDIVDEGSNKEAELSEFKTQLDQFNRGQLPLNQPLWIALDDAFKNFDFDTAPFYDMIRGQEMDLSIVHYQRMEDVVNYSYHVASTVGLMLLPILAPASKKALAPSAVKLGYAMQITNILRDIGEDYERKRCYIPEELMQKYGYTKKMLAEGTVNEPFVQIWEEMAAIAEDYYREGLADMHLYPLHSRLPVQAAAHFYKQILQVARANDYDIFQRRAFVTPEQKKSILNGLEAIN